MGIKNKTENQTADKEEIIQFYTKLLRMENDVKLQEALKAAEFFVKYLGILDKEKNEDARKVVIVDDIAKVKGKLND